MQAQIEKKDNTVTERKTGEIIKDINRQLSPVGGLIRELFSKSKAIWNCILMSFIVNFAVEALCRQSLYECVVYIHNHTFSFLYNVLIVLFTYSIGIILKKRYFYYMLISIFWIGLGVTSAIILSYRQTPLTAGDFLVARSALGLFDKYLSTTQMILLGFGVLIVIIAVILVLLRAPRPSDIRLGKGLGFIGSLAVLVTAATYFANNVVYSDSNSFASLIRAFDNYGFAYSFSITTFDGGVDQPVKYDADYMNNLKQEIEEKVVPADNPKSPNIVYLQLESFMDVNHITDYTYSEDPVPNFKRLKEEYPSGFLTVPSIGGGTANTEFEVLTGLNMDYFGAGEYPYKTIMKKTTAESVCYNLRPAGYTSHAIHNYTATFYDRNLVYKNLGFDTFTSMEYMYDLEYTKKGWAKDRGLINDIMKALRSTDGKDFIHTVSVQGHGQYPNERIDDSHTITMEGIEDAATHIGFEYYINELHDMDKFINELTIALSEFEEDVVLVMWGDHLPTFSISEEQLSNGNIFQTEYIIWSNYGLDGEDCNLHAYQLTAHLMTMLGRNEGWATKLHQTMGNAPDFDERFRAVEYDLLYGGSFLNGGVKYEPTNLVMGIDKITIDNAYVSGEELHVAGQNFNRFSVIVVDGEEYDTRMTETGELTALDVDLEDGSEITVAQKRASIVGSTEPYIFKQDNIISIPQ